MVTPSNAFLARYLAGECSADEVEQLRRWVGEDEARRAWLHNLETAWRAARLPGPAWDVAGMWGAVERAMRTERRRAAPCGILFQRAFGRRPLGLAVAAATAAAAAVVLGIAGTRTLHRWGAARATAPAVPMREYETARGQRATLQLPDGSRLVLAPASRLRIPATFGHPAREVQLEGEALFDVVHDAARPFRVLAKYAVAQDIGTRFDVRAYPEDSTVTVAVEHGAVALGAADGPRGTAAQGVVLAAGELGMLGRVGRVATTRGPAVADHLAWAQGRLVLVDVPLDEAMRRLGRWYGVDIELASPTIVNRRVTATLTSESPLEALQFVASFLDLTVVRAGHRYTLQPR